MRYHDGCFAECLKDDTRQRIYIIFSRNCLPSVGSRQRIFYFFKKVSLPSVCSDTRQSLPLCRVPWPDTRQRAQLCRVSLPLHSAKLGNLVFSCSFCQLCRVQWALHSAKRSLPSVTLGKASIIAYFFLVFTFQHFHHTFKQKISQIFITFFKSMTFITYISQTPFRSHKHKCLNISHRNSQVQKLFII